MKILELCLSPGRGGLELYVVKVCNWAKMTQHEVFTISRNGSFLNKWLKETNANKFEINVLNRFFPVLAAKKIAKFLDDEVIDVIHMHWGKDLLLAVLSKYFSQRPVRIVYTRQMALTRVKHDFYHRFLYKNIDKYVVISHQLYQQAINYLPISKSNVQLLYYGVSVPVPENNFNCDEFLRKYKAEKSGIKVGLFGRIEHGKGQHILLEAVNGVANEGIKICAYLVGHIMDQNYFDSLKQYASEKNFAYIGFHENPSRFMHCFDVIVLASYCETFGLVLIEAMRAGTAVIGTRCGGVPEIIENGKTGLLFESGDSDGLKNKLIKLIMNVNYREKLALAGKISADERFSEENHFIKLEAILSGRSS
jgi:glycosyltransferase involved in cell wall biosynthesis